MSRLMLTGANGRMAQALRPAVSDRFTHVRLHSRNPIESLAPSEENVVSDLTDLAALERACADVDVIVHLGGKADEAAFDEILDANIIGTHNIFEAARRQGVRRVVYASSHHVTGFYPPAQTVDVTDPVRPDTLYGVSKVFGEGIARLYHDKWGLEVVCLRIGVCREAPENPDQLWTWLSQPDSIRLVLAAAQNDIAEGFATVYGMSNNSRAFWARDSWTAIGYVPADSADDFEPAFTEEPVFSYPHQGGRFASDAYQGGVW